MHINVKKMHPNATIPTFGTSASAGMDLSTSVDVLVKAGEATLLPLGIAVEFPEGVMGFLALRSSSPRKFGIYCPNGMGVIDQDYRGEMFMQACAFKDDVLIKAGTRIAQLVLLPSRSIGGIHFDGVTEVETLNSTKRGEGGFGSTG